MPFSGNFRRAFEQVIEPAIRRVRVKGRPLAARIINRATSGSPDIHEQIFDAILHSRLVIADMTVQASYSDEIGTLKWQANANVAYEVGLAAAWRNPEDILLIHQGHPQPRDKGLSHKGMAPSENFNPQRGWLRAWRPTATTAGHRHRRDTHPLTCRP